jgi:integrase
MAQRERVQLRKRAGHWYARFTDNDGVRRERCLRHPGGGAVSNKVVAGGMANELADLLDEGKPCEWFFGGTRADELTFSGLMDEFLAHSSRWSGSTRIGNSGTVNQLRQEFGEQPLSQITTMDIEKYLSRRRKAGLSESSINRYLSTIKVVLEEGVKWGYLLQNPAAALTQRSEGRKLPRPYRDDEVKSILAALDPQTRKVAELYLHTGLRRGEMLKLRWSDVDLADTKITIRAPKNGRDRVVPLSHVALNILTERQKESKGEPQEAGLVYGARANIAKAVRGVWNVLPKERCEVLRPVHSFRDTAITRMANVVPLHHVQEFAGHASIEMTRRYAEVSPQDLHKSVARAFNS